MDRIEKKYEQRNLMRKIIINITLLLAVSSCTSQNKLKKNQPMDTFNIEEFNNNKIGNEYFYRIGDSIRVKQTEWNDDFMEYKTDIRTGLQKTIRYFKDGNIKSVSEMFSKNFIFNYNEYDKQGNLVEEIDYSKDFDYSWKDIKMYLKKHNIDDIQEQVINITRDHNEKETIWELEFNGTYKELPGRYVITLDGKTGEELEVKLFKGKKALATIWYYS